MQNSDLIHNFGVAQPLRFSGAHVWVRVEGSDAVLGLSDYLQDQMGEITTLDLPDLGDVIRATRKMGRAESEDASSPLESPLTGEVIEVNSEVLEHPDVINSDPYGSGWLLRMRMDDPKELEDLMNEEEYVELTTEV
jgi:glycine cleavage system H protein